MTGPRQNLNSALRAFAPFAGAAFLAWLAVLVGTQIDWVQYSLATALALAAGACTVATMMGWRARGLGPVLSALLFLASVGLLRNSAGGITSGASALAIIPVFNVALYSRSRRDLCVVLGGLALFYLLPILLVGGAAYPQSQYRAALLALTVSSIIGLTTQGLVAAVRREARQARTREQMLEQINTVVDGLYDSPQARTDVCDAVREISGASVALIFEPGPNAGHLRCSAVAGMDGPADEVTADRRSAVQDAFRTGRPELVTKDVEARVGSIRTWIASGRPTSVLYQPLVRAGVTLGVLVVGWPDDISAEGTRRTVTALLAHEAAGVIARADTINNLTDEAQTDALTGLPNRRAWAAELSRALAGDRQPAVAMLDLDHFKQFNDTFGHPAGDRLLKEAAATWRDQLRVGDVLARLGGEEFGVLLPSCDEETALEVVGRLLACVPEGRTCSAGIAIRGPDESAEDVVARADQALYEAKAAGRDRAHLSVTVRSA